MEEIRDMQSIVNSIKTIKKRFEIGVIEPYKEFKSMETANASDFGTKQYEICYDGSTTTPRWTIISRKNFFGINAVLGRENGQTTGQLFLEANPGRFRIECPPFWFKRKIDISDILERNEEQQYCELTEFYNMNNRQFFKKFVVSLKKSEERKLATECLLLDSLLEGKYEEIKDLICHNHEAQTIEIEMEDGTKIIARDDDKGVTITQGGKEASVNFDGVYNKTESRDSKQDNIDNLDVENITYTGDQELILQLQQAMQEQFKSQQKSNENKEENIVDDGYQKVTGYTKSEVEEVKKLRIEAAERSKEQAESLMAERYEEGKKYIYPERFEEWKEWLEVMAKYSEYTGDVEYTGIIIECLKKLENGEGFESVFEYVKNFSEMYYDTQIAADLVNFSKVGPEYVEYVYKKENGFDLSDDFWNRVEAKKEENCKLAEIHKSERKVSTNEIREVAEGVTLGSTTNAMSAVTNSKGEPIIGDDEQSHDD